MDCRVVALLVAVLVSTKAVAGSIDIYYDAALTQTEISVEPYEVFPAYVAIGDSVDSSGVVGWMGTITFSDSLIVVAGELSPTGINVATFPDYEVAYMSPVPVVSGKHLLATVTVMALGSGDICVGSTSGELVAVYNNDPGVLVPLVGCQVEKRRTKSVHIDALLEHEVSVGEASECQLEQVVYVEGAWDGDCLGFPEDVVQERFGDWSLTDKLYSSSVCLLGTVIDVDYRCIQWKSFRREIAVLLVDVSEQKWGDGERYEFVVAPLSRSGDCMCYFDSPYAFEQFGVGDFVLIAGKKRGDVVQAGEYGIYRYDGGRSGWELPDGRLYGGDILEVVTVMRERKRYELIQEEADLIVLARLEADEFLGGEKGGAGY